MRDVASIMGLFDTFLKKRPPQGSWAGESGILWEVDFDLSSLGGIRLGDPASLLWKLGRPENDHAGSTGSYCYYSRGVQVDVEDNRISGFVFFWSDPVARFKPFTGTCRWNGQPVALLAGMTEKDFQTAMGEPYWRDDDGEEAVSYYIFGEVEWQVEIDAKKGLTALVIVTPPSLKEESVRQDLKITRPWPPAA